MFSLCHYVIEADYVHAESFYQTPEIKGPPNTHSHTLSFTLPSSFLALISPSTLSLSLPFQQGNSMLSNFFQMSSTSLPPFSPALFPLF